ncbi:MAG: LytR/AlgR family response regulator transcription factor [Bacteroidota bacterium]
MEQRQNKKVDLTPELKEEFARLFFVGFGVFLFILFFQPFPLIFLDNNNRLLYVTGFGALTFAVECMIFILLPLIFRPLFSIEMWENGPPVILNLIFLLINGTAFTFYIRYVGKTELTLYILFKVLLVCLFPLIILIILYKNRSLEKAIVILQDRLRTAQYEIRQKSADAKEEPLILSAESGTDRIILPPSRIRYINSADNYVEINYTENQKEQKLLLRNTLKKIENKLGPYPLFVRCHRTCIVNITFIEKLERSYSGYSVKLKDSQSTLPVSRQYIHSIREALNSL